MPRYDVVIIGAGTAGSFAAQLASKSGLRVALLDRKPTQEVGNKVCGDEISETHFDSVGLEKPKEDEISCKITGADLYPPNLQNPLVLRKWKEFNGWTVNRLVFGQRMLNDAIAQGVDFYPQHHVTRAISKGKFVVGVKAKNHKIKTSQEFHGEVIIDASGYPGVIRMQLNDPLIEKGVNLQDIAVCYREIVELPDSWVEEGIAEVIMSIDGLYADHGYCWLFPKGGKFVNVGTGVRGGQGIKNPKYFFKNLVRDHPKLEGAKTVTAGTDVVPVRRPIWSLVTNGLVFVGDSALQVNPMHGGGIGRGLRAAKIAIETITQALEIGDVSTKQLWSYNKQFHSTLSARLAPMDLFRIFIQSLNDKEINYGFSQQIIKAEDLMRVNRGEDVGLSIREKLVRLTRGIGKIGMLRRLQRTLKAMKSIKELYQNYPDSPKALSLFKLKVLQEYSRIRT